MAVWPWLFQSQAWPPLMRRSVSPNETGSAILTCWLSAYQMSMVWVPLISEVAENTELFSPAMFGSDGKPRFAVSVRAAVIDYSGLAFRSASSNCAGVCLGRFAPAALASIVPARTPAAVRTAAADIHPTLLRNIRRGLIAPTSCYGILASRYPLDRARIGCALVSGAKSSQGRSQPSYQRLWPVVIGSPAQARMASTLSWAGCLCAAGPSAKDFSTFAVTRRVNRPHSLVMPQW